jgi:hypothetical protein
MSGGSYSRAYQGTQDMAICMLLGCTADDMPVDTSCTYRDWFAKHLVLVAHAMKAVEWEDSGDTGEEDTRKAIVAVMEHSHDMHDLTVYREAIEDAMDRTGEDLAKLLDDWP